MPMDGKVSRRHARLYEQRQQPRLLSLLQDVENRIYELWRVRLRPEERVGSWWGYVEVGGEIRP